MFDLGFSELLLTAVVALLVLGPERLPRAAKMAGLWVRRARATWYGVRAQLERELADDELRRSLQDARSELHSLQQQLNTPLLPDPAVTTRPANPTPRGDPSAPDPAAAASPVGSGMAIEPSANGLAPVDPPAADQPSPERPSPDQASPDQPSSKPAAAAPPTAAP